MELTIQAELDKLEQQIYRENISQKASTTDEWGGADVIICKDLNEQTKRWAEESRIIIGLQNVEPKRRVVLTEYSKELSWLFHQLKDIFSGKIDYISKYDFYGILAQSAINYQEENKETSDMKSLLIFVLDTARGLIK